MKYIWNPSAEMSTNLSDIQSYPKISSRQTTEKQEYKRHEWDNELEWDENLFQLNTEHDLTQMYSTVYTMLIVLTCLVVFTSMIALLFMIRNQRKKNQQSIDSFDTNPTYKEQSTKEEEEETDSSNFPRNSLENGPTKQMNYPKTTWWANRKTELVNPSEHANVSDLHGPKSFSTGTAVLTSLSSLSKSKSNSPSLIYQPKLNMKRKNQYRPSGSYRRVSCRRKLKGRIRSLFRNSDEGCQTSIHTSVRDNYNNSWDCTRRYKDLNRNVNGSLFSSTSNDSKKVPDFRGLQKLLEETCTSGSGSGLPFMVQQTISRQITLRECIGQGRFGEVWRGTYEGESVAVKIFSSRDEASWVRETELYNRFPLHHENILGYFASDITSRNGCTQLWIVTMYHANGSLYDYLQHHILDLSQALLLAKSASAGLCYLHTAIAGVQGKPSIVHRDIKSKNILVQSNGSCCIADLGMAITSSSNTIKFGTENISCKVGTKRYMSPELLEGIYQSLSTDQKSSILNTHGFDFINHPDDETDHSNLNHTQCCMTLEAFKSADVYAFALVMWEIYRRCQTNNVNAEASLLPYWDMVPADPTFEAMYEVVCAKSMRPVIPPSWSSNPYLNRCSRLIQECWRAEPSNRLTMLRLKKTLNEMYVQLTSSNNAGQDSPGNKVWTERMNVPNII